MEKVKVMIVDDQYIARQLFEMYIKSSEKYKLVMQVDSAALATKALKGNPVDLILMDILMSDGSNGLSAACEIKKFMTCGHPYLNLWYLIRINRFSTHRSVHYLQDSFFRCFFIPEAIDSNLSCPCKPRCFRHRCYSNNLHF